MADLKAMNFNVFSIEQSIILKYNIEAVPNMCLRLPLFNYFKDLSQLSKLKLTVVEKKSGTA